MDDGKKNILGKKNTYIKCTFKRRVFFRPKRGDNGGTLESTINLVDLISVRFGYVST
jgi:hypothetical protein